MVSMQWRGRLRDVMELMVFGNCPRVPMVVVEVVDFCWNLFFVSFSRCYVFFLPKFFHKLL